MLLSLLLSVVAFSESDFLDRRSLTIPAGNPEAAVRATLANPRAMFDFYQPKLDDGTKLLRPISVTGSNENPHLSVGIEKCIFVICQKAEIEADISVREESGSCDRNWRLEMDISQSSAIASDEYDLIYVNACFKKDDGGVPTVELEGFARRGRRFQSGIAQNTILNFLRLQVSPMGSAFLASVKKYRP